MNLALPIQGVSHVGARHVGLSSSVRTSLTHSCARSDGPACTHAAVAPPLTFRTSTMSGATATALASVSPRFPIPLTSLLPFIHGANFAPTYMPALGSRIVGPPCRMLTSKVDLVSLSLSCRCQYLFAVVPSRPGCRMQCRARDYCKARAVTYGRGLGAGRSRHQGRQSEDVASLLLIDRARWDLCEYGGEAESIRGESTSSHRVCTICFTAG